MLVVDSQVHVWAPETPDRPWETGGAARAHRAVPLGPQQLLREMDAAGVDRAFLVAPGWEGPRNDLVVSAARQHPERFAALGRFALDRPDLAGRLRDLAADPAVLGFRAVFMRDQARWLTDGTADWLWPVVADLGLPICIFAPGQHAMVRELADRHRGVQFVIDHLGIDPAVHDGRFEDAVAGLLAMADLPHVAVKASSLPSFVSQVDTYPFPRWREPLHRVIAAFGPERVFWGSDLTRLTSTYADARDHVLDAVDFLDESARAEVMGRAICRWFGWPVRSPGAGAA